ncbi:MAG: hypothetical protein ACE5HJ_06200 [Thermoplasmata archaeon]
MALELALLILLLFLPGYLLVNVVFPARGSLGGDLDSLYRVFLGVLLSVSITIIYGSLLVILVPSPGRVLFLPQYLWPGLTVITILLFLGGVYRGAYPRISTWLGRPPARPLERPQEGRELLERLTEIEARLEQARAASQAKGREATEMEELISRLEEEKRSLEEEAGRLW